MTGWLATSRGSLMFLSMGYETGGHVLTDADKDAGALGGCAGWWAQKGATLRNEITATIEPFDAPGGGKGRRGGSNIYLCRLFAFRIRFSRQQNVDNENVFACLSEVLKDPRQSDLGKTRNPPDLITNLKHISSQSRDDAVSMLGAGGGAGTGMGVDRDLFSLRLVHCSTSRVDLLTPVLPLEIVVENKALAAHVATGMGYQVSCPSLSNTAAFVVRHQSLKVNRIDDTKGEETKQEFTRAREDNLVSTRFTEVQRIIEEKANGGKRCKSSTRRQESRCSLKAQQEVSKTLSGEGAGDGDHDETDDVHDGNDVDSDGDDTVRFFRQPLHERACAHMDERFQNLPSNSFRSQHDATTTGTIHMRAGSVDLESERLPIAFDEDVLGPFDEDVLGPFEDVLGPFAVVATRTRSDDLVVARRKVAAQRRCSAKRTVISLRVMMLLLLTVFGYGYKENYWGQNHGQGCGETNGVRTSSQ